MKTDHHLTYAPKTSSTYTNCVCNVNRNTYNKLGHVRICVTMVAHLFNYSHNCNTEGKSAKKQVTLFLCLFKNKTMKILCSS